MNNTEDEYWYKSEKKRNRAARKRDDSIKHYLAMRLLELAGYDTRDVVQFTMDATGAITVVTKAQAKVAHAAGSNNG